MGETADYLNEIKKYIHYVGSRIKIDKVILFGSFARGNATKHSDVDLAIISTEFGKAPLYEKMNLYGWRHKTVLTLELQPFPFSPEQFASDDFFVEEIRRTGIDITDQVT